MSLRQAAWDSLHTRFGPNTIARLDGVIRLTFECWMTCRGMKNGTHLTNHVCASLPWSQRFHVQFYVLNINNSKVQSSKPERSPMYMQFIVLTKLDSADSGTECEPSSWKCNDNPSVIGCFFFMSGRPCRAFLWESPVERVARNLACALILPLPGIEPGISIACDSPQGAHCVLCSR